MTQPRQKPTKMLQKLLKAWQKTSLYYFFFDAFFLKQILKLGATVHYSVWGTQNQKEAPKVLQKLLKAWQKN